MGGLGLGGLFGGAASAIGKVVGGAKKAITPPPQVPTLGAAQLGQDQQDDFLRKRRGVLANLYGGGSGNAASGAGNAAGGGATLLGQ